MKEKFRDLEFVDSTPMRRKIYIAVSVVAVVVLILLIRLISYISSISDINAFESKIKAGDSYVAQSKHNNAIDNYIDAYTNYDGYQSKNYKKNAFKKIKTSLGVIIKKSENNNSELYVALQTVNNINKINLQTDEKTYIQQQQNMLNQRVNLRVKSSYDQLAKIISKNHGKLDSDGKQMLEELLLLAPTDYWLNLIKEKEK